MVEDIPNGSVDVDLVLPLEFCPHAAELETRAIGSALQDRISLS